MDITNPLSVEIKARILFVCLNENKAIANVLNHGHASAPTIRQELTKHKK